LECPAGMEVPPPIGRPIANTQIYLLDQRLQPVPVGVPGELYVGGVGVARGYYRRPELTAERFIPNPFSNATERVGDAAKNNTGSRLYKTGDMARYRVDGNIEFLGRIDQQVKIRGFRIELGEIESVLQQHEAVSESIAVIREDGTERKCLVAYVVPRANAEIAASDLLAFLRERLPEHMIPQDVIVLAVMPLTPNGKLDRQALPAPTLSGAFEVGYVAPRNAIEEQLAQIWMELLGCESIGVHDSFFELGGHSLLIAQLVVRIYELFGVELPLRNFFETPTVEALGGLIAIARGFESGPNVEARLREMDWEQEAKLDPKIRPDLVLPGCPAGVEAILVTGASGFLGAFLLYELLERTDANIYCLVRAHDILHARKRIKANLLNYGLWIEKHESRIFPVVGDLAEPRLGASDEEYGFLTSVVDTIYHNGGMVNFVAPYSQLKAANVLGTQEVLRFASLSKRKQMHFVSTLSVFLAHSKSPADIINEEDAPDDISGLDDGYAQSKWVAERLVLQARARGLSASIYRPARITGHGTTGQLNPDDFLSRLFIGCIQLCCAPDWDILLDMAPVDFVSRAIVCLSRQLHSHGKAFHLMNNTQLTWQEFVESARQVGFQMRLVTYDDWRALLLNSIAKGAENALKPVLPMFYQESGIPFKRRIPQFDCRNTLHILDAEGIVAPAADQILLEIYLGYIAASGLLEDHFPPTS
ncbi:MAG: thioester reductase domain-containing protein, partial [Chloroflexia bacterium]